MTSARRLVWIAAPLASLAAYWRVPFVWFRVDDFAWLALLLDVRSPTDLWSALFSPAAQGTVRVLSERAYFLTLTWLFGVTSWPFRMATLGTWVLVLLLVQWIGSRLMGSRAAGLAAALLWAVNATLATPLAWASAFNQVLCAALMLAAFASRLLWIETGFRRWRLLEAAAFLTAFGVLEIAVMYPAVALLHAATAPEARRRWRSALWMVAPAAAFAAFHLFVIPKTPSPIYERSFDVRLVTTLWQYIEWTVAPWLLEERSPLRQSAGQAVAWAIAAALAGFAVHELRRRRWFAAFGLGWFLLWLAPVLPLTNHISDYYLTLPGVGLAWLAGSALTRAWQTAGAWRLAAAGLALLYACGSLVEVNAVTYWYLRVTSQIRVAVRALEGTSARHPGSAVLLVGMDDEVFLHSMPPGAPRVAGVGRVWLTPEGQRALDTVSATDAAKFRVTEEQILAALERGELRVLDVSSAQARDITLPYHAARRVAMAARPGFVDVGQAAFAERLGAGWFGIENGARWSAPRARLRLDVPAGARKLRVAGFAPAAAVPVTLQLRAAGRVLGETRLTVADAAFEAEWPLTEMGPVEIDLEVSRALRIPGDPRELGLIFGTFTAQ